jgi:hypothetical protein
LLELFQFPGALPDNRPRKKLVLNNKDQEADKKAKEQAEEIHAGQGIQGLILSILCDLASLSRGNFTDFPVKQY